MKESCISNHNLNGLAHILFISCVLYGIPSELCACTVLLYIHWLNILNSVLVKSSLYRWILSVYSLLMKLSMLDNYITHYYSHTHTHSSSMAGTLPRSPTSLGTPTTRGWCVVSPKTTSCKCGKWQRTSTMTSTLTHPLTRWSNELTHTNPT